MKLDGGLCLTWTAILFLTPSLLAQSPSSDSDPAPAVAAAPEASAVVSEEARLTAREAEIRQELLQLAREQQEIQKEIMESHQAQGRFQEGVVEKDQDIADLRRRIEEAERTVADLREQLTKSLVTRPEYAAIKERRDAAFARRSELIRKENSLSEELVRVQTQLKAAQGQPSSSAGTGAP